MTGYEGCWAVDIITHRCPKCDALVVDRRSPVCTNCHEALPDEWVMSGEQKAKVMELDAHARAEFDTAMNELDTIPTDAGDTL
jgi:hypothetical protein